MIYPLVKEMAAVGARVRVPVAVACRILGFSKQGYYKWLKQPVSAREAEEQGKPLAAHYAHLVVHGVLHLRGYDHERGEADARQMEDKERTILASLGFDDPYQAERD